MTCIPFWNGASEIRRQVTDFDRLNGLSIQISCDPTSKTHQLGANVWSGCNELTSRLHLSSSVGMTSMANGRRGIRQTLDDRAIGPLVTMAMIGQVRKRVAHLRQFGDAAIEIGH